jgi:cytochrome c-type biogenesis protein CcmH/NrfG
MAGQDFRPECGRAPANQGSTQEAAEKYTELIRQNLHLEEVIKDLQDALYRYPVDVNLWVALGDAYIHTENLKEALSTLSKAEDLVR